MHRVARLRVGEAEAQHLARRQRGSRTAKRNARRRQRARVRPSGRSERACRSSLMPRAPACCQQGLPALPRTQPARRIGDVHALQPGLEFRRALQAQHLADIELVVEGGRLVVQHHVVGAGNAHDEVDAGRAEQGQQRVHVVLIGLGMVGVADVAAHRHAHQLAAEMVLEAGADDLLAVIEIFRADEADDRVDQQRLDRRGQTA